MKKLIFGGLLVIAFASCEKDKKPGVCYCEFFKGDPQEYDLSDQSRSDQIDQCYIHDQNANGFGGECELE